MRTLCVELLLYDANLLNNFLLLHHDTLEALEITAGRYNKSFTTINVPLELITQYPKLKTIGLHTHENVDGIKFDALPADVTTVILDIDASIIQSGGSLKCKHIDNLRKLRVLQVHNCVLHPELDNGCIEELLLDFCSFTSIAMANLKYVHFKHITFNRQFEMRACIHLESITITQCTKIMPLLEMLKNSKNLKHIKFNKIEFPSYKFEIGSNVRVVIVQDSRDLNFNFLKGENVCLEVLKIKNIMTGSRKVLDENSFKIKHFIDENNDFF